MSVDLIVLRDELTAIYFPLSHDTLSVVGSIYYTRVAEPNIIVNVLRITNLIKNKVANQVIKIVVSWVGLTIFNPI